MATNQPVPWNEGTQALAAAQGSASAFGVEAAEEDAGWGELHRYLSAFRRHKWAILLTMVVGTGIGAVVSRFVPKEYGAQATMWIEPGTTGRSSSTSADKGPIQSGGLLDQSNAWVDLLRSFVILDYVVTEQHLYIKEAGSPDAPDFGTFALKDRFRPGKYRLTVSKDGKSFVLQLSEGQEIQRGAVGTPVGPSLGFDWTPDARVLRPGRRLDFEILVPREVSLDLAKRLRTQMDQSGTFMKLELTGQTAPGTARVLNAVLDRYVQTATDLKRAKLDELTRILKQQLAYSQDNLQRAENDLQAFRVHTITLPSDQATPVAPGLEVTQNPVLNHYFQMKIEADQLRQDRDAIQNALKDSVQVEALESIASVQKAADLMTALKELTDKEATLRALRYRYTEEHPPVIQLEGEIATLRQRTIPKLAMSVVTALSQRVSELESQIGSASVDLQQIPPRAIEEARLQRQVTIADNLYTTLQQRFEEARLAAVSSIPDVRILDKATVPQQPLSNPELYTIALAFALSLGLGLVGAVARDRLDPTVRYPEQVTAELGLPILGTLPHVTRRSIGAGESAVHEVMESLRTLRLSLLHAYGSAGPIVFTISSPGSGDGKSVLSSNLALSFADLGKRTLLIDGDTRRGGLHHLLQVERRPGLTDFLRGGVPLEQVIRETAYPALNLLPCGTRLSRAPELLGSPALRQLMALLRPRYDVIIIDSSPMGAGADAFLLGTLAGNMLIVARAGTTDKELMEAKLELLERLPIRILGVVMNDVTEGEYGHYFGYGYYLPGYEAENEDDSPQPPAELQGV
jgi:capsular exopolysaccharide synthesis family protein